jgi:hypothetical protein
MELTVVPIIKPDAANFIFGAFHQDRGRPPRGAGRRGPGHPLRAGFLRGLREAAGTLVG